MNVTHLTVGLLLAASAAASAPSDFASKWTLGTDKVGAFSVVLEKSIYQQVTRADLSDLAAFNADGEELAFGRMPPALRLPAAVWQPAAWFALPASIAAGSTAGDLQLHVRRSPEGNLALDATLPGPTASNAGGEPTGVSDVLIDVRAKDRLINAIAFDFMAGAPDFSATVRVEASDDLQHWRELAADAPLAQLNHERQLLLRHMIDITPQAATYLRLHANTPLPLRAVQLRLQVFGADAVRQTVQAEPVSNDGHAFVYRLPAAIAVDRLQIALAGQNQVADIEIDVRNENDRDFRFLAHDTVFRLQGEGAETNAAVIESEPLQFSSTNASQWRIRSSVALAKPPTLTFGYLPESWVVLTSGRPPYVLVAGSRRARRDAFPIEALIAQMRAGKNNEWRPPLVQLGPMRTSAGAAALSGWDASARRTWLLWGILLLGALAVVAMVIKLLRSPPR